MSKTFRHCERFHVVRPTRKAKGWMDSELTRFHEEESESLSELIDAASMAAWVLDHRHEPDLR